MLFTSRLGFQLSCVWRLVLILSGLGIRPAEAQTLPGFHLTFDDETANAVTSDQGVQQPLQPEKLRFVKGVRGSAVYLGKGADGGNQIAGSLKYAAGYLFSSDAGTVSFWVKPDWDGLIPRGTEMKSDYRFFAAFARNEEGGSKTVERKIWLWMWNWLRCDLKSTEEKEPPNLQWKSRNSWMKGDWWHVAVTWDQSDGRRLYLNGVPVYRTGQVNLDGITDFLVGRESPTQLVEAAFDEFKIYQRSLTREEIESQFREFSPLDFTLERRFFRAGSNEQLSLEVSPSKTATKKVMLDLEVRSDATNETIVSWSEDISDNTSRTIHLPLVDLPVGDYRLQCILETEQGNWQRSYPLTVYQQREAPTPSKEPLQLGECLVDIDLTAKGNDFRESVPSQVKEVPGLGRYLEVGAKKWDRIAVELPKFSAPRSPVVVEIEWPDDKERSMSFYLFVASERKQHRDRLSGGVQCGGEYLSSGKMRKTRYLFYPESDRYLFELRTLVDGLPAAASRLKIYALKDRLPKLAVELPADLPTRNIGHLDEDQSFEILMPPHSSSPLKQGYTIQIIENLLDYNDYTGQNTMSYPVLRYSWSHLDTAPVNNVGSGMRVTGWISLLMDMMEQRNQNFFPAINLYTIAGDFDQSPEEQEELARQGQFLYNSAGKAPIYGSPRSIGNNPVHPAVKQRFLAQIDEITRRFGKHEAFKGINLWLHTPAFFTTLEQGYGDYTIAVFEKETGIKIPVSTTNPDRFLKRYHHLTGPGRNEWLAWRAKTNLAMINEVNLRLQQARKGARLYLNLNRKWQQPRHSKNKTAEGFDLKSHCYQEYAMDLDSIDQIDTVSIAPLKGPTESRSNKHWDHGAQNLNFELMTDANIYRPFRSEGKGVASLYYVYVESFMNSLSPEKYASYFQNSDPKAAGRDFLAGFSISMASQNPETIFAGAQPLGTMGREDVSREFIRNFRALPAGHYEDLPSMSDPVTVRSLSTAEGTYLYQVNLLPWSVETVVQFPQEVATARDLGESETVRLESGRNGV